MKRAALTAQKGSRQGQVCQLCQFSTSASKRGLPIARSSLVQSRTPISAFRAQPSQRIDRLTSLSSLVVRQFANSASTPGSDTTLKDIARDASALHESNTVASNEVVVDLLQRCQRVAELLSSRERDQTEESSGDEGNAISSLLDMEEKQIATKSNGQLQSSQNPDPRLAESVSKIAIAILKDEKVFISPEALASCTETLTLLRRAEHFPEIFHLYANKPVPEENSSPVKLLKPNPKSVNSAVPAELANKALGVAIEQKNLPLVLAIIDNTFCAPAFHRAKIFKKAGVPLIGLAAAPAACYAVASWAATFQNTMDPNVATGIAFAATLAYVGGTSSMGILAITTANDQMERVVWIPGIPLRQRWLREEERAAMDRVACAWGFKDPYMRGEEVGEEWASLREFIGMRGMILDKTELMVGME
ncbi:unnamed protein product [Penicillium salamii]|uniref:Uncharacterized protein n=1 Tax=Penicillium salamii TaxID=1612424 RepID=A0A9W4JRF0_9EURO|nr:unnamed protein product [Penicillium salamii]CAG8099602.1 unnamed protein product [Penicillium salamii]CAG8099732.1 unnamed protein product [Penicillium salamii]CAG8103887.1 unnamed protein product [Penicillium salamii]CAG8171065.1 unnamed protein product [Penicillium salamii]